MATVSLKYIYTKALYNSYEVSCMRNYFLSKFCKVAMADAFCCDADESREICISPVGTGAVVDCPAACNS